MTTIFDTATCIGCGCDDDHACMQGCGWLRVNRHIGRGVCVATEHRARRLQVDGRNQRQQQHHTHHLHTTNATRHNGSVRR